MELKMERPSGVDSAFCKWDPDQIRVVFFGFPVRIEEDGHTAGSTHDQLLRLLAAWLARAGLGCYSISADRSISGRISPPLLAATSRRTLTLLPRSHLGSGALCLYLGGAESLICATHTVVVVVLNLAK